MTKKEKTLLQKEIVDSLDPHPHGRLLLAPRVGKSKLAIDLIKRDKPDSILWVTPSAELATVDIPGEFAKWGAKRYLKKLTTVTWTSLDKMGGCYDMVILDEEQYATQNNLDTILSGELQYGYIVSMTGTPTKHVVKQELYKKLNLKPLYTLGINEAVDIGLLSNYEIKVLEVDLGKEKNIPAGTKEKPFLTSEESQYNWLHKTAQEAIYQRRRDMQYRILARRRAVANSPAKQQAAEDLIKSISGRKLIFAGSIEQAEKLCQATYHSKTDNEDLKAFQEGEIDEIAMVDAGGTGFTYKEIDHLIVVQCDSDKNGRTSQKISRTLLRQKDYQATIWILSLIGTKDETWVANALQNFDKSKVHYIRHKNFVNLVSEKLDMDNF